MDELLPKGTWNRIKLRASPDQRIEDLADGLFVDADIGVRSGIEVDPGGRPPVSAIRDDRIGALSGMSGELIGRSVAMKFTAREGEPVLPQAAALVGRIADSILPVRSSDALFFEVNTGLNLDAGKLVPGRAGKVAGKLGDLDAGAGSGVYLKTERGGSAA